ncbi:aminotransferase class I/II-fold pyridoxal phosphate-dependent enzyme [Carnimonas bestiolae]|uniref:aminotransferase class I/II-fold pyridoxal phosphate-dependent enzyme n=1 Tax=Carnimonas bestiolae TaxID=3402172 RepID=UPI003EDC0B10
MRTIAAHLRREGPNNPFPGLAAAERKTGRKLHHQLGSNEGLDMAHHALQAQFGDQVAALARRYSDAECYELRRLLAAHLNIDNDEIVVDAGADSLLALSLRALCEPGTTVVCSAGTYPTFSYFAQSNGCRLIEPRYIDTHDTLAPDLAALNEAAHLHHARLVYLANPDNPSGYTYSHADIVTLRDSLPEQCSLLLDEAYYEFSAEEDSQPLEGVIRLRTFSKAYGLAGLRVGYAIAEKDLIEVMLKARIHYAVASVSLAAAEFLLTQQQEVQTHIDQVVAQREKLTQLLSSKGLTVFPSVTNFVALRLENAAQAAAAQQALLDQDVIVHRPPHPALGHILRITTVADALQPGRLDALFDVIGAAE